MSSFRSSAVDPALAGDRCSTAFMSTFRSGAVDPALAGDGCLKLPSGDGCGLNRCITAFMSSFRSGAVDPALAGDRCSTAFMSTFRSGAVDPAPAGDGCLKLPSGVTCSTSFALFVFEFSSIALSRSCCTRCTFLCTSFAAVNELPRFASCDSNAAVMRVSFAADVTGAINCCSAMAILPRACALLSRAANEACSTGSPHAFLAAVDAADGLRILRIRAREMSALLALAGRLPRNVDWHWLDAFREM